MTTPARDSGRLVRTTVAGTPLDGAADDQELGRGEHSVRKRKESGQSLVEFSLVLPIILIVVLGVANLGLAIRGQLQLAQVSQEAVQYLVHNPSLAEHDSYAVTLTGASSPNYTLTTTGGTGGTTANISSSASAATVQVDLASLPDVGAGNVTVTGSAGGPYTVNFVGTASVTNLTANSAVVTPFYGQLVSYINTLSSYQLSPLEVHLTVSASRVGTETVQQDTVTINYPFPLIFPMVGKLSVGTLHSGAVNLGATASTIAETHPPTPSTLASCIMVDTFHNKNKVDFNANGCPDFGQSTTAKQTQPPPGAPPAGSIEILWQPPVEALAPLSLPLKYCIERVTSSADELYYSDSSNNSFFHSLFQPINSIDCVGAHPSMHTTLGIPDLYFADDNCDSTGNNCNGFSGTPPLYSIRAIQDNGMTSAALAVNP